MIKPAIHPAIPAFDHNNCSVLLGTCGYSYREWVDAGFYPPGTRSSEMLGQYARQFQVVELNYTWYQMARADAVARMMEKAPSNFRFAAKVTRTLTHERDAGWKEQLQLFKQGIAPLRPQLVALLIQLPPDFVRDIDNRRYLAELLDGLAEYPLAVEFRHNSWAVDSVYGELEKRRVTLVCVDCPDLPHLFPITNVVTNPEMIYVRFHGRNRTGWKSSNMQRKFDYMYSPGELQDIYQQYLQPMMQHASNGLLFFNNHVRGQAPQNATQLAELLGH